MSGHDDSQDGVKTPIGGLIGNREQETAAELQRTVLNVFAAAGLANSERFELLSEVGRGGSNCCI
jgi:hypothetical protein